MIGAGCFGKTGVVPASLALLVVLLTAAIPPALATGVELNDGDYLAKCLIDHVKPGMDASAVASIRQACARLATPKRCRDTAVEDGGFFSARAMCVRDCKEASFYERKFGACSVG